jgi:RNA polymerase sigma factor (sigma-70 family)
MRYGGGVKSEQIPLSWLYRIAERCCYDRKRRDVRTPIVDPKIQINLVGNVDEQAKLEASEIVLRYFYKLDEKLQQLALLYYVDGLPQEQIATELKWSRRTVGKKLKELHERAKRLRQLEKNV